MLENNTEAIWNERMHFILSVDTLQPQEPVHPPAKKVGTSIDREKIQREQKFRRTLGFEEESKL